MKNNDKRYLTIVFLLVIVFCFILTHKHLYNFAKINVDINKIPLTIGSWQGKGISLSDDIFKILETEDVLVREYSNNSERVSLSIVYYEDSKLGFHRPEACFVGQGSTVLQRGIERVDVGGKSIETNKIIVGGNSGQKIILYFFQTGNFMTAGYPKFRWQLILNRLKAKKNGAAMIQISSPVIATPEKTLANVKQFAEKIMPLLPKYLQ
ncbi:MAG: EpsI family protein [Candidatus Omnitrophica bacterium]|nr:EpsI family protein [Candidatus Omnitrophota bacterium]